MPSLTDKTQDQPTSTTQKQDGPQREVVKLSHLASQGAKVRIKLVSSLQDNSIEVATLRFVIGLAGHLLFYPPHLRFHLLSRRIRPPAVERPAQPSGERPDRHKPLQRVPASRGCMNHTAPQLVENVACWTRTCACTSGSRGASGNVNDKKVRDGDALTYASALAYGFTGRANR